MPAQNRPCGSQAPSFIRVPGGATSASGRSDRRGQVDESPSGGQDPALVAVHRRDGTHRAGHSVLTDEAEATVSATRPR